MADTGTGIDIVISEASTHHFLHKINFFIGTARRRNSANTSTTMTSLNMFKSLSSIVNRFIPRHFFPGVFNALSNHRFSNAVLVSSITKGESAFNTGMALVGFTIFVGRHTHDFIPFHLSLK